MSLHAHLPRLICTFACLAAVVVPFPGGAAFAQTTTIAVETDRPGENINPAMWGIFFEDINFGADGGLYAEMVKNGSLEFPDPLMGWFKISPSLAKGDVSVLDERPYHAANPHYLRIASTANAPFGVSNVGFRGMGVKAGDNYNFSAQIRGVTGRPRVTVEIVGGDGTLLADARLNGITNNWQKISATLTPRVTDPHARMTVILQGQGAVDLDMVSLFPEKTWKNRPGGLRADMVQALADLKPGFFRFPGGCIVEGSDMSKRYQWKTTIGPLEERKLLINRWNYEFKHRPTPDYYQSFGLGFFEYFQLCEDIGAEPMPIINCGMACQFNSAEVCTMDELGSFIQDAIDLIEFANGPATSPWGARRAAMGHPAPFNMKLLGIGNEQWGPTYIERLGPFLKALKEKHPEITLISAAGPSPDDDRYKYLWPKLVELNAEIADEHCYANPIWFLAGSRRYDNYDRNGPKVFFGEYAAQSVAIVSTKNRNNLECALAEAAFMTGMERNADVVRMASYAPLFAHVDAWQWRPDMIWVDNLTVAPSPNYYVQQLFCHHRGDVVLLTTNDAPVKEILPTGRVGLGTQRASAEFRNVRVTRGENVLLDSNFAQDAPGWSGRGWQVAQGVYRQPDANGNSSSFAGDKSWGEYTLTLRARKTGGDGALVITVCDNEADQSAQWILGAGNNQEHVIQTRFAEQNQMLGKVPGSLENNRWYDVKIVVSRGKMECYLDNNLVQSAEVLDHRIPALFTSATRDNATGETILKVVNPGPDARPAKIQLKGAARVAPLATATILAGDPTAENSPAEPANILPKTAVVTGAAPEFNYTFEPHSMTVIRLNAENSNN